MSTRKNRSSRSDSKDSPVLPGSEPEKLDDRRTEPEKPESPTRVLADAGHGGALTDDEKIALVQERYAPMRKGYKAKRLEDLAEEFGRDPAVISSGIISAFQDGLVDIEVIRRPTVERLHRLEEQLIDRYDLKGAIVVSGSGIRVRKGITSDPKLSTRKAISSDELHRKLGYALATYIGGADGGGLALRDGDSVAFGSGRSVFYTCKSIAWELPQRSLRVRDLNLVSLTGAVHARDHSGRLHARLDADFHCGLFGMCTDNYAILRLISHSIAHLPEELENIRQRTWLGEWDRERAEYAHVPDVALIGMGVLSEGHRFYEQAKANPKNQDPILRPIIGPLRELVELCDAVNGRSDGYHPVADICNNLLFVEPPAGVTVAKAAIETLIDTINSRLLNISPVQLQQVGAIILCAATPKKAQAVKQLLLTNRYNVKLLCIDDSIAHELLA
jgi:DNA-binding transcriptional regulator LsrR (DeoR family)